MIRYRHDSDDPASLSSDDVKSSGEDKAGTFWVGTSEGLDAFDRATGKVTLHVPLPEPVQISFYEDRLGVFWIYHASGSGLAVLDRKTKTLTRYSFYENEPPRNALTGVMGMVEDPEGNLWLGSIGIGLLRLDRESQRLIHYKNNPADPQSLAEDKVCALFKDREGNIWTGLHSMGPNHFSTRPPLFETFRHDPTDPNSLDLTFINAVYEDRCGNLWIGNDNALNRLDRERKVRARFTSGLGVKPMVITIIEDRSGGIWVGTYGNGLARLDQETGSFKVYKHRPGDPTSLSNDQVHRMFVDHCGVLWVATGDGLNRFDPERERFDVYKVDWQSRHSQSYVCLEEDRQGILWIGTHYSGLHRFDPRTGKFTVYKADPQVPGSLSDDIVATLHIDRRGAMWVGTQNGLDEFDPATNRFTTYYDPERRDGNIVSCLLEDERGNLWLSSNKGVSVFNTVSKTFKNYSVKDGLPGNDLTGWGGGSKSSSGENVLLWICRRGRIPSGRTDRQPVRSASCSYRLSTAVCSGGRRSHPERLYRLRLRPRPVSHPK